MNIFTILTPSVCFHEIILFTICISGDNMMSYLPLYLKSQHLNAILDNMVHGMVGFFSWAVVIGMQLKCKDILQCILCLLLACLVDVDHFLAAGSLRLKDALSLPARPPFHATTIIPVITAFLYIISMLFPVQSNIYLICFTFFIAWTSHHIRDSTRRGLWLPPFGSTPSLPYTLYICLILILPLLVRIIFILRETPIRHHIHII